eukprot:gene7451-8874_t
MIVVFLFLLSAFLGIIVSAMDDVKAQNTSEEKADLFTDLHQVTMFYFKSTISEATLLQQLEHWGSKMHALADADADEKKSIAGISRKSIILAYEEPVLAVGSEIVKRAELESALLYFASMYGISTLLQQEDVLIHRSQSVLGMNEMGKAVIDMESTVTEDEMVKVKAIAAKILRHLGLDEEEGRQ